MHEYLIHDSGAKPWKVSVEGDLLRIFALPPGIEEEFCAGTYGDIYLFYTDLLLETKIIGYYVGEDKLTYGLDELSNLERDDWKVYSSGNTIIAFISKTKCLYIGPEIYYFKFNDTPVDYFSPLDSEDCPHPALEGKKYVYIMEEQRYFRKVFLPRDATLNERCDLHSLYCGNRFDGVRERKDEDLRKYASPMKDIKVVRNRGDFISYDCN